jgi:mono/diheme cytochrome c family protein
MWRELSRRSPVGVLALVWLTMLLTACEWPWRHDMVDQPSTTVSSSSRSPIAGALPTDGETPVANDRAEALLHNPIPADAPVDTGRSLYHAYCVPCHGADGESDGPVSKYFGSVPPLDSPEVQQHGDGWWFAIVTNGTDRMPSYKFELKPDERWQIVHFIRSAGVAFRRPAQPDSGSAPPDSRPGEK